MLFFLEYVLETFSTTRQARSSRSVSKHVLWQIICAIIVFLNQLLIATSRVSHFNWGIKYTRQDRKDTVS